MNQCCAKTQKYIDLSGVGIGVMLAYTFFSKSPAGKVTITVEESKSPAGAAPSEIPVEIPVELPVGNSESPTSSFTILDAIRYGTATAYGTLVFVNFMGTTFIIGWLTYQIVNLIRAGIRGIALLRSVTDLVGQFRRRIDDTFNSQMLDQLYTEEEKRARFITDSGQVTTVEAAIDDLKFKMKKPKNKGKKFYLPGEEKKNLMGFRNEQNEFETIVRERTIITDDKGKEDASAEELEKMRGEREMPGKEPDEASDTFSKLKVPFQFVSPDQAERFFKAMEKFISSVENMNFDNLNARGPPAENNIRIEQDVQGRAHSTSSVGSVFNAPPPRVEIPGEGNVAAARMQEEEKRRQMNDKWAAFAKRKIAEIEENSSSLTKEDKEVITSYFAKAEEDMMKDIIASPENATVEQLENLEIEAQSSNARKIANSMSILAERIKAMRELLDNTTQFLKINGISEKRLPVIRNLIGTKNTMGFRRAINDRINTFFGIIKVFSAYLLKLINSNKLNQKTTNTLIKFFNKQQFFTLSKAAGNINRIDSIVETIFISQYIAELKEGEEEETNLQKRINAICRVSKGVINQFIQIQFRYDLEGMNSEVTTIWYDENYNPEIPPSVPIISVRYKIEKEKKEEEKK